jgi:hypothetical protein
MGFLDYPFPDDDANSFMEHDDVLAFLNSYANKFQLRDDILVLCTKNNAFTYVFCIILCNLAEYSSFACKTFVLSSGGGKQK